MSCYLVSKPHIDAIVALAATEAKRIARPMSPDAMNTIGRMLIRANVRSIEARYPDTIGKPEDMPGPNFDNPDRAFADTYQWSPVRKVLTPVALASLVACYEYQTCEFDGWEESEAFKFCETLKSLLFARWFPAIDPSGSLWDIPGFDHAMWTI